MGKKRITVSTEYMKISELSLASGVSIPRIRYYLKKGALPDPVRINRTQAFYTQDHLKKLQLIKLVRPNRKFTPFMKQMIWSASESADDEAPTHLNELQIARRRIINPSITVFRKHGYEGTTIEKIAKTAHISRNTIYKYFKNKNALFLACINELILEYVERLPARVRRLTDTKDTEIIKERMEEIGIVLSTMYMDWYDMLSLLRAAAVKEPRTFAKMLDQAYISRISPILSDIEILTRERVFRKVDPYLVSIMMAGAQEYAGYFAERNLFAKDWQSASKEFIDIFLYGILRKF